MEKLRGRTCMIYIITYFLVIEQLVKTGSMPKFDFVHVYENVCLLDDETELEYDDYIVDTEAPKPQKYVCCPGYTEMNSNDTMEGAHIPIKCGPLCTGCEHGHCVDKEHCQCNLGYVKDATGSCVPQCKPGCPGSVCIQPDRCKLVTTFADGLCDKPECVHGCLHEGKCLCINGYEKLNNTFCVPVCDKPCGKGHCIGPNMCNCDTGYHFETSSKTCKPICQNPCIFGKCVLPGVCECPPKKILRKLYEMNFCTTKACEPCPQASCSEDNYCPCGDGYEFNGSVCEPQCTKVTCGENTFCSAPNKCSCLKNYRPLSNRADACEPICYTGCLKHGTCTDNVTCICDTGYKLDGLNCVPTCSARCRSDQECVAPNECRCREGYMADGEQCYPYCPDGCDNGYCRLPNKCACYSSFSNVENKCVPSTATVNSLEEPDIPGAHPFSAQEIAIWCMLSMDKITEDDLLDFSLLFDPDESRRRIFRCASMEACEVNCTENSFDVLNASGGFVRCKVILGAAGTGALKCYTKLLPGVDIVERCRPAVYSESGNKKSFLMSSSFSYSRIEKFERTSGSCWLRPCSSITELSISGRNIEANVCPYQDGTSSSHLGWHLSYIILSLSFALGLVGIYFYRRRVYYYLRKSGDVQDVDEIFNNLSNIRTISSQLVTDD